jgi:DNA-binding NarL/FixJ family response regulator
VTAPPITITVLVADDDPQVRSALGDLIGRRRNLSLAASVADGAAAGAKAAELRPAVAVVDVRMPAGGVEAVRRILEGSPDTAVVVYTAFSDPVLERQVLAAGAMSFALKGDRKADIVGTIEAAASESRK